jgi:hypothetical protein
MLHRVWLALILILFLPHGVLAQKRDGNVRYSQLPYWEVGVLDADLSTLCANGRFNLLDLYAFNFVFNGPVGPGVMGVAKSDWNLSDPAHAGRPATSYYFLRDRTTDCQVYRWGPEDQRKKMQASNQGFRFSLVSPPSGAAFQGVSTGAGQ